MSSTDRRKTDFRGAVPPAAELDKACQETIKSSLGDPYRNRKMLFILPGEGTLSRMSYGRRSDVFDEE
jgi:hypothetical protein